MRNIFLVKILFIALAIQFTGCSSSDHKPEDAAVEATLTQGDDELPASDEVGSIPEDNPEALDELATTSPSKDPFADLEDNIAPKEEKKEEAAANNPQTGEMREYKVRKGDTLMKVAFKLYGDIDRWKDIKNWNRETLRKSNRLELGQVLTYSYEGDFVVQKLDHSYKIQSGDTLAGISKNIYGKTNKWKKLQKYNHNLIKNPNRIFAGFLLYYNISPKEQQEAEAMRNQIGSSTPSAPAPMQESEQNQMPEQQEPEAIAPAAQSEANENPPTAIAPQPAPSSEPVASAPGSNSSTQ